MRYLMKQRMFSLTDSYLIRDEQGDAVFRVRGHLFSLGDRLDFEDMDGNQLVSIRQKLISLTPTYEIYRNDTRWAVVSKELFTLFRARFLVDVPGPGDLEVEGDFLDHEYTFKRGTEEVAEVSKSWFSITDTYGVDIQPGEDDVLILASSVVIDLVSHDKERGE